MDMAQFNLTDEFIGLGIELGEKMVKRSTCVHCVTHHTNNVHLWRQYQELKRQNKVLRNRLSEYEVKI